MQKADPNSSLKTNISRPSSRWRARLWMIPPIILILVALHQIRLMNQFHLNPSKGGAFRMFSTVDHFTSRLIRANAVIDGQEFPILMNDWLGRRHEMVCMSSEYRLQKETDFLIGKQYALIEPVSFTRLSEINTSDPRGQRAYERVYVSQDIGGDENLDTLPLFLVDADQLAQNAQDLLDAESISIEARRIVYEGKGRFTSKVVSSVHLSHE